MQRPLLPLLLLAPLAAGCVGGFGPDSDPSDEPALADLDALLEGAPTNDELPQDYKADANYPKKFTELLQYQSPVRNQGHRGVCSIFSTVALMEHLYIKEGTLTDPDFSEQYLQWAVKFEVGAFPNTSGSNARSNLQAISQYGIVTEDVWPYDSYTWTSSDDPACDGGDAQPTVCYTNGEPTAEMKAAQKYKLPAGRYINSSADNIKGHMFSTKTGVVVGLTFFYQAWNHGASSLPVNSEYKRKGYVLYPNEEDKTKSLEKRAGHSILLVGWDDDLEVQTVDKDGNKVVDADGNPVMEKGFFIFKNSWGTTGFGTDSELPAGYGYISMRYVAEYGSAYTAGLPAVERPQEICGDHQDNDGNNLTDCEDPACAADPTCSAPADVHTYDNTDAVDIPDNDPVGASTTITVDDTYDISSLTVSVDITHTYIGDLRVVLYRDGQAVTLHDRTGGGADDLQKSWDLTDFDGQNVSGEWKLTVTDLANADVGHINDFKLEVGRAAP